MSEFLRELFGGVESGFLTLTHLRESSGPVIRQVRCDDSVKVDDFVAEYKSTLYYNVGVMGELPRGERGKKADVKSVCCLWMDIDLPKSDNKKRYPPENHVMAALAEMPLKHTAILHTGGGFHVYWFFNQPTEFAGIDDAQGFESKFSKPWAVLFKTKLARYGEYDLDSVYDVTRMMRIPGSWHKNGKQCTILDVDYSRRYDRSDFEPYLEAINIDRLLPDFIPTFTKPPDGKLSVRKLDALLENSPAFKKVYTGKDTRLGNDGNKVDASLARHAVDAGWNDDEIADLLFTFNEKHRPERLAKLLKPREKFGNLIGVAIAFVRGQSAKSKQFSFSDPSKQDEPPRIEDYPDDPENPDAPPSPPKTSHDELLENLAKLSSIFGIPVARWVQIGREEPLYILILADGKPIRVGGAAAIRGPEVFIDKMYSYFPLMGYKTITKAEWKNALIGFGRVVEVVEAPEVTISEMAIAGISQYLQTTRFGVEKERDQTLFNGRAYYDGRLLHLHVSSLVKFLNMHGGGHKWNNADMVSALTTLGFERGNIHYEVKGGRSSKSYWSRTPDQFTDIITT